jgi:YVTN family beta-propeller protein
VIHSVYEVFMRRTFLALAAVTLAATSLVAQSGAYKILTTEKVGGDGGYDYVYADSDARRLYIARSGAAGHISVFDLDSLKPAGDIGNASAHGVAVDAKSGHGFASSKPITMFDAKTLATIKTITVQGSPDGIETDPGSGKIYVFSHSAPNVTVIDAESGTVAGTLDLGGAPEQAVFDGKGHLYVDLEDKDSIAVVDIKALTVVKTFSLNGKGGGCAGLAIDAKNGILFASCRSPQKMVILSAADGKIIDALPIGNGSDGAVFNPATMEAFSTQGDGTLTVVKENSPTSFAVEQTVKTPLRARTLTLDAKTSHIITVTAEFGPPPPPEPGKRPGRGAMILGTFSIIVVGK